MITDAETGEVSSQIPMGFDQETGEIWDCVLSTPPVELTALRSRFHVPQQYLQYPFDDGPSSKAKIGKQPTTSTHQQQQREEIILGYKKTTTHRLFLIPSLFFFFKFTALVLLFFELILHIWAHKKNSRNGENAAIFYRSPLHLISSQFCATCKHDVDMIKLSAIQDKRRAKQLIELSRSVG